MKKNFRLLAFGYLVLGAWYLEKSPLERGGPHGTSRAGRGVVPPPTATQVPVQPLQHTPFPKYSQFDYIWKPPLSRGDFRGCGTWRVKRAFSPTGAWEEGSNLPKRVITTSPPGSSVEAVSTSRLPRRGRSHEIDHAPRNDTGGGRWHLQSARDCPPRLLPAYAGMTGDRLLVDLIMVDLMKLTMIDAALLARAQRGGRFHPQSENRPPP
jgi:hypothetical protein